MGSGDFLRKGAQTPFLEHFVMAGVPGSIATNSESILAAARGCFWPVGTPSREPRVRLRFWVDPKGSSQPPWPKPFFRGLNHLIFAGFDSQNSVLVDLHSCRAIGRFSPAMGDHLDSWKTVIFPVLVSMMGATVGITELHCGCVAREGSGLLLAGGSGSGKSTLALALAQAGFSYLSDDRTYLFAGQAGIAAWGLPTLLKLRLDAADWFNELEDLRRASASKGEQALWIDPVRNLGLERTQRCEPKSLVFLQRQEHSTFDLCAMSPDQAAKHLEADLMAEEPEAAEGQRGMIANLVKLPCWQLKHGGAPQAVARLLESRLLR